MPCIAQDNHQNNSLAYQGESHAPKNYIYYKSQLSQLCALHNTYMHHYYILLLLFLSEIHH